MGITDLLLSFSVSMELIPKKKLSILFIIIFYNLFSFVILEQIEIRIDIMIIILFKKLDWKYNFLVLNLLLELAN
jgi:hypothetical protein